MTANYVCTPSAVQARNRYCQCMNTAESSVSCVGFAQVTNCLVTAAAGCHQGRSLVLSDEAMS